MGAKDADGGKTVDDIGVGIEPQRAIVEAVSRSGVIHGDPLPDPEDVIGDRVLDAEEAIGFDQEAIRPLDQRAIRRRS